MAYFGWFYIFSLIKRRKVQETGGDSPRRPVFWYNSIDMKYLPSFVLIIALCAGAQGAWYWPFSSDDEKKPPRISELMEPASVMIDEAYDLAADGKTSDAVEKFRAALEELDRIEIENPDRVKTPEFNTVKNKRATVTAAIDSLLLSEAQNNASAITVTDTTELQKKFDAKHGRATDPDEAMVERLADEAAKIRARMKIALENLEKKDFDAVERTLGKILEAQPNDPAALNLLAAAQLGKGDVAAAEKTLDKAISANPESYHAYYNMARLQLRSKDSASGARLYYSAGRKVGGPVDAKLEEVAK